MADFEHNDLCVGIDLGTTNSALATINVVNGKINSPVRNIQRFSDINNMTGRPSRRTDPLLPSCVYYRQERDGSYSPIVGDYAKRTYAVKPWLVAKSIKSQMGEEKVEGLQDDIPDKTPEAVSARILEHLIKDAEEHFMCPINDVVITVPASFNSAMREATLRAAEIAGISNTRNEDGTYNDDMLLSEPEAVMYDMINQIQEGTFDANIDFSEKKNVMVFDIGGGTLDITIHSVERDKDNNDVLNISPIAINRYTKIGGDDFDGLIADEMYKRYLDLYASSSEIRDKISKDSTVKPTLLAFAEDLKLQVSDQYYELKHRGQILSDDKSYDCGGYIGNGYSYDDMFTKSEFESAVEPLMGYGLTLNDFKNLDQITNTANIVYPVLNVMKKASEQLGTEEVRIDAVVLNGGMSKLYLVQNRLEDLFGFKPLIVADPDKSVAMGAAVYHYYLHKKTQLVRKMRVEYDSADNVVTPTIDRGIVTSQSILNEDVFLGLKGGATQLLCKAGTPLPYTSEVMTGFSINPEQNILSIPIKEVANNNTYRTIACGSINFKNTYKEQTPVSIKFTVSKSQILTLEAWTSKDDYGIEIIEKGNVILKFGFNDDNKTSSKMIPQKGSKLIAANEVFSLKSLFDTYKSLKPKTNKGNPNPRIKEIKNRIKILENTIASCGNPEDFAAPILSLLSSAHDEFVKQRLLILARKLSKYWSDEACHKMGEIAYHCLAADIYGFGVSGEKINTSSYAILAIGNSRNKELCRKLSDLSDTKRYVSPLIYAFAKSRVNTDWIYNFISSAFKENKSFQNSLWGLAASVQRNGEYNSSVAEKDIVKLLIKIIKCGVLNQNDIGQAVIALGSICDQRTSAINPIPKEYVEEAKQVIIDMGGVYYSEDNNQTERAFRIASELCNGSMLTSEDEEFLLGILNKDYDE